MRVLLDEICTTYGSEPTIARAETFRTGGVLGFFQREHYRLVIDDETGQANALALPPAPLAAAKKKAGGSLSALRLSGLAVADEITAGEEITAAEFFEQMDAEQADITPSLAAGDPWAAMADETEDEAVIAPAALDASWGAPAVIDDLPTFDEVLRRVATMVDAPEVSPVEWPKVAKQAGNEWAEPAVGYPSSHVLDAVAQLEALAQPGALAATTPAADAETAPAEPAPAAETAPGSESLTADILTAVAAELAPAEMAPAAPVPSFDDEDTIVAIHEGNTVSVYSRKTEAEAEAEALTLAGQDLVTRLSGTDAADDTCETNRELVEAHRRLARRLMDAGLGPAAAASVRASVSAGCGLESALIEAMDSLPVADRAPRQAGSLILVVGPGRRAGDEAVRLAAEVGTDPAEVVFATDRRPVWPTPEELLVRSAGDATSLAPTMRADGVGIVAVDAPSGSKSATLLWARRVIDAFDPTHVVAIADAMHKSEDVAAWIAAIGGVDTIVVDNVDTTASPARLTELGLPVSRLGDQPATPARWAATILDRVADVAIDIDLSEAGVGERVSV
ncbi:MAG TPA: hypothetical protein VG435_04050 [Acidimicrobiales bacterium]|nr:hypothetical protein [Acidimicrobiales bacterium]